MKPLLLALFWCPAVLSAAQLSYGKYFGSLQLEGKHEQIAVVLDTFLTQVGDPISNPNDPNNYPQVNALLRVNLGGFQSGEYVSYRYYKPGYNFEEGVLQLDDPNSDLSATLTLRNDDTRTVLEGPVVYRASQVRGHLRVLLDSDGFDASGTGADPKLPYLPTLSGEYRGKCGDKSAAFQIETGRGLGEEAAGNALNGYKITGRVGFEDPTFCPTDGTGLPSPLFCTLYSFSSGLYSLYDDKLTLQGPQALLDCDRADSKWNCRLRVPGVERTCTFERPAPKATPPTQFSQTVYLKPPADAMKPLPAASPPANKERLQALNGEFYGFLHHENRDLYQPIQLGVVATTSTQNNHIQNDVSITPTVSTFLGAGWPAADAYTTHFEQRVFYVNPGFALQANDADTVLVVGDWRQGYLRGVWYSRTYGRVGTFELQKGVKPTIDPKMKLLPGFAGAFRGPVDGPDWVNGMWWINLTAPGQVAKAHAVALDSFGQYLMRDGLTPLLSFDAGAFDPHSGQLSYLLKGRDGERLLSAEVLSTGELRVKWPPGPALGAPMTGYGPYLFRREEAPHGQ